jgi:hypothetical protein
VIALAPPAPPCVMVTLAGDAESAKLGAGFTVSVTDAVFERLPETPVIVTVVVPVAAVPLAVNVKELLLVVTAGLNVAVTPDGRPDADKVTFPLNPFWGVSVTVVPAPLAPCVRVRAVGDAESVKVGVGAAFTVRVTMAV